MNRLDGFSHNQFERFHMNDIPVSEDLPTLNILFYDIGFVAGNIIGEDPRWTVQKYEKNVRLLRYSHHIWYVSNKIAVFQTFCCSNYDIFFTQ